MVDAFWLKQGIAFLHVTSFEASNIGREVEAHMQRLGEAGVQGLILDLRGNLGGLVTEAVALAGRFLRNGQTVVSTAAGPSRSRSSAPKPIRWPRSTRSSCW